jgi:hypothetical protein
MAYRGFGVQTLTAATAQPVFGTTLTSAISVLTTDPHTGRTDPASQASIASAVVTSTQFFRVGDRVAVGPAAGPYDWARVTAITAGTPPAGTLTLKGLTATHANGQYVILSIPCAGIGIQPISVTASMYVGEDSTVSATSATLIYAFPILTTVGVAYFSGFAAPAGNTLDTPHLWIIGANSSDKYLPSILIV